MPQFKVLEGAPPEIYGHDVKAGDPIELTDAQAHHLLAKEQIEPAPEKAEKRGERD